MDKLIDEHLSNVINGETNYSPSSLRFRPNIFIDGPFNAFAEDKWPWVGRSHLSSPRAERARAVTVSQCPHSEVGQDFLLRRRVTLTETAVTRKRKV